MLVRADKGVKAPNCLIIKATEEGIVASKVMLPGGSRHGARVHKVYDTAKTPYQRLLERDVLSAEERETLDRRYRTLNPVRLKARLDAALEALWATADRHPDHHRSVTVSSEATYAPR